MLHYTDDFFLKYTLYYMYILYIMSQPNSISAQVGSDKIIVTKIVCEMIEDKPSCLNFLHF